MKNLPLYYIILYVIVIVLNFFKLRKDYKIPDDTVPSGKFKWKETFYVSNEILYTASGAIIILLTTFKDIIAVSFAIILLVALVSTNMNSMGERFSDKTKFIVHFIIIITIAFGTYIALTLSEAKVDNPDNNSKSLDTSTFIYKVALPYTDISLIKITSGYDYFSDKRILYYTKLEAKNEEEAINIAENNFWNDTLIKLYTNKYGTDKKKLFKIYSDQIIFQKIQIK
jgi:hypothetical protein